MCDVDTLTQWLPGVAVVDKEEMRKDRAVKITRKEVNALMQELFEYTELPSSDEEDVNQTTESLVALVSSLAGLKWVLKLFK